MAFVEVSENFGSAPDSPASYGGGHHTYTRQALDDLVSKILDEDSNAIKSDFRNSAVENGRSNMNLKRLQESSVGCIFNSNIWSCNEADRHVNTQWPAGKPGDSRQMLPPDTKDLMSAALSSSMLWVKDSPDQQQQPAEQQAILTLAQVQSTLQALNASNTRDLSHHVQRQSVPLTYQSSSLPISNVYPTDVNNNRVLALRRPCMPVPSVPIFRSYGNNSVTNVEHYQQFISLPTQLDSMAVGGRTKFQRRLNASTELTVSLEQCFSQLHCLEKEEKHAEAELAQQTPGRIGSSASLGYDNPFLIPRLPHNPSRVDKLVVESLRQHCKVVSLVNRLWQFRGSDKDVHPNISSSLETWMEGIRKVQARRKEEIVGTANRNNNAVGRQQEEKDIQALANAIRELVGHTCRARTCLWCAVQMTSVLPPGHENASVIAGPLYC